MKQVKWLFHPILVFIFSITALVASLFLYIYWYIEVSSGLRSAMDRFNRSSQESEGQVGAVEQGSQEGQA